MLAWGLGAAVALLLALFGVQTLRLGAAQRATAEIEATLTRERLEAAEYALSQQELARIEERRRTAAAQGVTREARKRAIVANRDAAAVDAAAGGLRSRAMEIAARCSPAPGDPAIGNGSPPAGSPGAVLADMLSRTEEAARQLAREADRRGDAGNACQQQYESLTIPGPGSQPADP